MYHPESKKQGCRYKKTDIWSKLSLRKQEKSRELETQLVKMLRPLLEKLDAKLDRRLVSTFLGLVIGRKGPPTLANIQACTLSSTRMADRFSLCARLASRNDHPIRQS